MNGLRVIVDASSIIHKYHFTFYNRDWNSNTGTSFGITCGKSLNEAFIRYRSQDWNT